MTNMTNVWRISDVFIVDSEQVLNYTRW